MLDKGTRYEGTALLRDFRITDFNNYQAVIDHQESEVRNDKVEQKTCTNCGKTTILNQTLNSIGA